MSQLARIFVVVNFLLAAGFLYAASMFLGLNAEWKAKHTVLQKQKDTEVDSLNRNIKEQKTRIDGLTQEGAAAKEEVQNLKGGNAQLTAANQAAESDKK